MWEKLAGTILRNRLFLIGVLVVVTGLMVYKAVQVELAYDNPKFIPNDDPDYVAYQEFKSIFGDDGSVMVVGINDSQIRDLDFFNEWYNLTEELRNDPDIKQILSIANIKNIVKETDTGFFEGDTFETQVFAAEDVIKQKPQTQEELDSLFDKIHTLKFYEGLLFKDSSHFTMMAITLQKSILDTKRRIFFVQDLQKKIQATCKAFDVEVHFSGLPYIRTEMSQRIQSELVKFTLVSFLITALILWFFFRSFPTLFLSLLTVMVGVSWCMGILVLLGYKITMFIGLLPPLIVVIGIANCIYLLNKYHEEYKNHQNKMKALQRVIAKVGLAVFFTNLTTAIGFGVFVLTGSTVLQEFGLTAFLSIMAVFFISIILIPVLFSFLPAPKSKHVKHLDYKFLNKLIDKISDIVILKRKQVYTVTIVLVVVSIGGMFLLKNVGYMVDDISKSDSLYKDLKFFEKNISGVMPFEIVIDTKKPQGVQTVKTLLNIDYLERRLSEYDEFSKSMSFAQTMKFLNQAYYNGDPRRYRPPSIMDLGNISAAVPQNNSEKRLLSSLVDSNNQKARVSVQMADVGSVRIKELREEVNLIADSIFNYNRVNEEIVTDSVIDIMVLDSASELYDTTFYTYFETSYEPVDSAQRVDINITGTSVIFLKGNDYLISNLLVSLLVAFIIISLLMAGIFTSGRMILISLIPNTIPLIFTAGIMGYSGVNFKPSTVLVFSVAFGIAVDFSIHFLTKYKMELKRTKDISLAVKRVQKEISTSMIYTAVILFFGFIIFVASNFGGTIALGLFTAITLFIALLCNLLVLPSLLISYDIAKSNDKSKPFIELEDV
ncbi:MMPL family transporter [bacterium]|nr:MMPL family transporter [bacterium]